eukprot:305173-Chlamydomonas_euryale.AAC.2
MKGRGGQRAGALDAREEASGRAARRGAGETAARGRGATIAGEGGGQREDGGGDQRIPLRSCRKRILSLGRWVACASVSGLSAWLWGTPTLDTLLRLLPAASSTAATGCRGGGKAAASATCAQGRWRCGSPSASARRR